MDPQIFETPRSREGTKQYAGGTLTREFTVLYQDWVGLFALLDANVDLVFNGFARKSYAPRSLGAPDCWLVAVEYGSYDAAGGLRPDQFSFKLVPASAHVTQSLQTLNGVTPDDGDLPGGTNLTVAAPGTKVTPDGYLPVSTDEGRQIAIVSGTDFELGIYTITAVNDGPPATWTFGTSPAPAGSTGGVWYMIGTAPDNGGAIGVSLDTVQGCDIVVPQSELTFSSALSSMTAAYVRTVRALIGKTNDAPFLGYPTGTLLYLGMEPTGAEGSLPNTGGALAFWNLAHTFKYEPDVTNVTIGGITVPYKPGHAYLWVRYAPTVPTGALLLGQQPVAAYVEQVYLSGDMTALGISL